MNKQNGYIEPAAIGVVCVVFALGGLIFIGGPQYNVW